MEVFQNEKPEAPTRLGDLLRKERFASYLWIPGDGAARLHNQSGPWVYPGEHTTALGRLWWGFASVLSSVALTRSPSVLAWGAVSTFRSRGSVRMASEEPRAPAEDRKQARGLTSGYARKKPVFPPHLNLQTSCFYLDCWAVYTLPRSRGVFTHRAWPDWQPLSPPQQRRSERLCRLSGVGLPCWMPLSVFSARCHLPRPTIWNLLWLSIYYKRK